MSGEPAEIKFYRLPRTGLFRKLFSLTLSENEECLPAMRVSSWTDYLPRDGCLWITSLRIVLLQYRLFRSPQMLEIPRSLISSIDWNSGTEHGWIDVKYQGLQGLETLQLRIGSRSRDRSAAFNRLLLKDLHQSLQEHKHQRHASNWTVPEAKEHVDLKSKLVLFLSLAACVCCIPYFALRYPEKKAALSVYDSAPECHTPLAAQQPNFSSGQCTVDDEKIARLYYRTSRSKSYYVVLQDGTGLTETAHLLNGKDFYQAASSGDVVRVQRFMGEVILIADGNLMAMTDQDPHEKISGIRLGLWMASIFLFGELLLFWYLRNSFQW